MISDNTATTGGGGVSFDAVADQTNSRAELLVTNSTIEDNDATGSSARGGKIRFVADAMDTEAVVKLQITSSTITGNTAGDGSNAYSGGSGVHAFLDAVTGHEAEEASVVINQGSVISGNHAYAGRDGSRYSLGGGGGVEINTYALRSEIRDATITGNTSTNQGGGVLFYSTLFGDRAELRIQDSTITGNQSEHEGGGLAATLFGDSTDLDASKLIIQNTEISDNGQYDALNPDDSTTIGGGAFIYNYHGKVMVNDTIISGNDASLQGGGAYILTGGNGSSEISRVTVTGNESFGDTADPLDGGGGLWIHVGAGLEDNGASTTIRDSTIADNTAKRHGGGIFAELDGDGESTDAVTFNIFNSTISGNTSETATGGGIHVCERVGATFLLEQSTVSGNYAMDSTDGMGGGIALVRFPVGPFVGFDVTISHSTITNNYSPGGGGLFSELTPQGVNTVLTHTIISGNVVSTSDSTPDNVEGSINGTLSEYNLVGRTNGNYHSSLPDAPSGTNIHDSDNDPGLNALADNGGPTLTHMPMTTSEVIDAGNDQIVDPPTFDGRGSPFLRVFDGDQNGTSIIDIGAVESWEAGLPVVLGVEISGSLSNDPAFQFASSKNYDGDSVVGSGKQLSSVPVALADTVTLYLSEPISNLTQSSLAFMSLRDGGQPTVAEFTPHDYAPSWRFSNLTLADQYLITLVDTVIDGDGNALDGDWTNPADIDVDESSGVSAFPSGDNVAGGQFEFVLNLLTGDIDGNAQVNAADFGILAANIGSEIIVGLFIEGDFNGSGTVDAADVGDMFANWESQENPLELFILIIAADSDGDYDVDNNDDDDLFLVWQRQFGIDLDVAV